MTSRKPLLLAAHYDHGEFHPRPFLGRTIMRPAPIVFPREPFAEAGREHARLLEEFCQTVAASPDYRAPLATSRRVDVAVGLVVQFDELVQGVTTRAAAIELMRLYRGVCRPLFVWPREDWLLPVVVSAFDAISLNFVRVHEPRSRKVPQLSIVERNCVVEPTDQRAWETATEPGATITAWRVPGDDELRYAWAPTPDEPVDEVELIDRLAASYEAPIAEKLKEVFAFGIRARSTFVTLVSTKCCGDMLDVQRREWAWALADDHPWLARAIEGARDPRRMPALIMTEHYAGVRWLALDGPGTAHFEAAGGLTSRAMNPVDPRATSEFHRSERLDYSGEPGITRELEYLVGLTEAELKAEIILAGFEPSVEAAHGPGLRARVVAAMAARRAAGGYGLRGLA